jgi:hypothetical protein
MVCGSYGSAIHGLPRATHAIDIVIAPTPSQLEDFLARLSNDDYVSPEAARAALQSRRMFNVIDTLSGDKVDLIVCKDRPFSAEELSRRMQVTYAGISLWVASPEDVILSKLEWARAGDSERQFRDALTVAIAQAGRLDLEYLGRWATRLGVPDLLERLLRLAAEAGSPGPQP